MRTSVRSTQDSEPLLSSSAELSDDMVSRYDLRQDLRWQALSVCERRMPEQWLAAVFFAQHGDTLHVARIHVRDRSRRRLAGVLFDTLRAKFGPSTTIDFSMLCAGGELWHPPVAEPGSGGL